MNPPTAAPTGWFGFEQITWDGIATIVAALIAAAVAVLGYALQQRHTRRERRAVMYSEALRAVEDYLEAPFLIRRRDGSAGSRQEITTHVSEVQSRLSYYTALLGMQGDRYSEISSAYQALVASARAEAGAAMSAAWRDRPTRKDSEVPLGHRFDRSRSDEARRNYLDAINRRDH